MSCQINNHVFSRSPNNESKVPEVKSLSVLQTMRAFSQLMDRHTESSTSAQRCCERRWTQATGRPEHEMTQEFLQKCRVTCVLAEKFFDFFSKS